MSLNLEIEWLCLREFLRLIRRDHKYLGLVLPMYSRTVYCPPRSQVLRAAYCFARLLDDVLDGDRPTAVDPENYVRRITEEIQSGGFSGSGIADRLGCFVFDRVDRLCRQEDRPSHQILTLIDAMLFDYERAHTGMLLDSRELHTHHIRTFEAAQNVTLCIAGSDLRASDIPRLAQAQSCLYTLRDLEDDLSRGLVNIPLDVILRAKEQGAEDMSYRSLTRTSAVIQWMMEESMRGSHAVGEAGIALAALSDRRARMVLRPLHRGLRWLAGRLNKSLPVQRLHDNRGFEAVTGN